MSPRLLLLTGPDVAEVANVFRLPCSTWPECCGFEVRDYLAPARAIIEGFWPGGGWSRWELVAKVEAVFRTFDGLLEALVGLVLPDPRESYCHTPYNHPYPQWECVECRGYAAPRMGARLAILAPEPPPLLVERVRAWGGEVWECFEGCSPEEGPVSVVRVNDGSHFAADDWADAVRAALGEAPAA